MDDNRPITRQEFEDCCAAARANPSPLLTALRAASPSLLVALRARLLAPKVFSCEDFGISAEKLFEIKSRIAALEEKMGGQDLSAGDTMTSIDRARTYAGTASVAIGPSQHGKFHNSDGSINLAEVLDEENQLNQQ